MVICHLLVVFVEGVEMIPSPTEQQVPEDTPFEITCHGRNRLPQTSPEMRLSWLWIPDEPINGVKKVLLNETVLPPGNRQLIFSKIDTSNIFQTVTAQQLQCMANFHVIFLLN